MAAPFCVAEPVMETFTVGVSPEAVPHAPLIVATATLVMYGNVRMVPLTAVSVTTGAVVSTVIVFAPLVPELPPLSSCVAVTE